MTNVFTRKHHWPRSVTLLDYPNLNVIRTQHRPVSPTRAGNPHPAGLMSQDIPNKKVSWTLSISVLMLTGRDSYSLVIITFSQKNPGQNQNCYWWYVQVTIIHQDLWSGKLVPSPCKRSELSNRVFCTFSSRKERRRRRRATTDSVWQFICNNFYCN